MYHKALTRSYAHRRAAERIHDSPWSLTWAPPPVAGMWVFFVMTGGLMHLVDGLWLPVVVPLPAALAFRLECHIEEMTALVRAHRASSEEWMRLAMRARKDENSESLHGQYDSCMKLVPPSMDDLQYGEKMANSKL